MSLNIIKNQNICGAVVIPENPISTEDYASTELRYYFNRMTANPVEIVKTNEATEDALIIIGGALTNYGEERLSYADDEIHWYTKNGKVFIDGGKRGILYAMYDFLESLGCRFFTPKAEKIPTYTEFVLEDTDKREKPIFEYREFYFRDTMENQNYSVKYRTNERTDEKYGGRFKFANHCHSFGHILPYSKYFDEHPEWYSMYDGERKKSPRGSYQLCLSNPEVTEKLIEGVREVLRRTPDARVVHVSQNDAAGPCQCENCRAIDKEEGSPAGLIIRTVNAIAEALEEEFPNVLFLTFAYAYGRTPPKLARPRHNVAVQYCTIEACFAHPIESECGWGPNSDMSHELGEWSSICNHTFIWDYNACFWHLPKPHPNWHVLQPNMQFFAKNNAKGIFSQGELRENDGCDLDELRCYLICKLMWDPYCDFNKHLVEFTDFYYGDAAPMIREYIETMCKKCEDDNLHFNTYGHHEPGPDDYSPYVDYLTPDMMLIYNEILDRAEMAVRDDPIRRMRVDCIRLGLRYTTVRCGMMSGEITDAETFNQFVEDCLAHNITIFQAGETHEKCVRVMADKSWRK
ncbi:MAG: DUF4838 domain-containing protein [Ruminococcaceae bacterium]|nr:DUF4838 domain-containing protein [Oscillospiraceae bacterium]